MSLLRNKKITITLTQLQAEKLGIVTCNCGHPPNNHFLEQKGKPCAHCTCKKYKQEIWLPSNKPSGPLYP